MLFNNELRWKRRPLAYRPMPPSFGVIPTMNTGPTTCAPYKTVSIRVLDDTPSYDTAYETIPSTTMTNVIHTSLRVLHKISSELQKKLSAPTQTKTIDAFAHLHPKTNRR